VSPSTITNRNQNELARALKHEGVRVGEIIAYRAWRVITRSWLRNGDDRLHSVLMKDYVWHPDEAASGDVRTHGIYSFRDVIRSREEYLFYVGNGPLLFGKVKIWGEVVEHEWGYRSQFEPPRKAGESHMDLRAGRDAVRRHRRGLWRGTRPDQGLGRARHSLGDRAPSPVSEFLDDFVKDDQSRAAHG
jgi:hypothetical protein